MTIIYDIQDNYLASITQKSHYGAIKLSTVGPIVYPVPKHDDRAFSDSVKLELKATTGFELIDVATKKPVDSFLKKADITATFDGEVRTKPVDGQHCSCIEGEVTIEVSVDMKLQARGLGGAIFGGDWGAQQHGQGRQKNTTKFSTCTAKNKGMKIADVSGTGGDQVVLPAGDFGIAKLNAGTVVWTLEIKATEYKAP